MTCNCVGKRIIVPSEPDLEIADSLFELAGRIIQEGKQLAAIAERIRKGATS